MIVADSSVTAFAFSRHVSEVHGYPPTKLDLNLGSNFSANCRRLTSYCRKGSQEFHVDAPTIGSDGWVARISRRLQRSSMLRILMIVLIPRGRMKTIALGLTLGVLVSAVNLRGMESHVVSAFPHVLILIVLPVCLFGVLWLVYRTSDTCSRRDVRRAGMVMVMSGAFVFSISHVIAGIIHFGGLTIVPLSIFGFVIAFTSFVVIGALTVWVVSKWLVHADTVV